MKKAIYKITNKLNGKCYIGQSNNPMHRWTAHKSHARCGYGKGKIPLYDALRAVGEENFVFEIIGWFDDYNQKEQYFIQKFNSMIPTGYNIMPGGEEPPHKYGEGHHTSKYSQKLIDDIINDLLSRKYTQKEIELKYKVSQQLVTSINRGVTHRRKGISYPIIKTSKYHLDDDTVNDIIYLLGNSLCTCAEIGKYFGIDTSAVKAVNTGRNHRIDGVHYPIRNFRGKANFHSVETILANRSTATIDTVAGNVDMRHIK